MSKSGLIYENYSWTAYGDDDPKVTGEPDRTLLNRKEGYEIFYFINKMASIYKLEKMIHDQLPGDIRSQKNVKTWIIENWDNY